MKICFSTFIDLNTCLWPAALLTKIMKGPATSLTLMNSNAYSKIYPLPIADFQEKYAQIVLGKVKKTLQFFQKHLFRRNLRKIKLLDVTVDDMKCIVKHESDHWENTLKKNKRRNTQKMSYMNKCIFFFHFFFTFFFTFFIKINSVNINNVRKPEKEFLSSLCNGSNILLR